MNMLKGACLHVEKGMVRERGRERLKRLALASECLIPHSFGSMIGGASAFLLTWLLLTPLRTFLPLAVLLLLCVAAVILCAAIDLRLVRRAAIFGKGQVPSRWLIQYGFARAYTAYGVALGAAVFTYAPFALVYSVLTITALMVGLESAVLAGAVFGLGRATPLGGAVCGRALAMRLDGYLKWSATFYRAASVAAAATLVIALVYFSWSERVV